MSNIIIKNKLIIDLGQWQIQGGGAGCVRPRRHSGLICD